VSIQDVYAAPTIRALAARLQDTLVTVEAEELPYHRIAAWKRWLCWIAQTVALLPIYTVAGLQWFFPYVAYTHLAGDLSRVSALLLSGLSFILIPPLAMFASIAIKWLVIGRYRAGITRCGAYYFRWWFVRRFSEVIATPYLAGTPMIRAYYRLLGAKIGKRAFIGRGNIDVADLVTIGEDAVIGDQAMLATSSVERGLLRLGSATVEAGANVGSMAVVGRNSTIGAGAVLEGLSALPTGAQIPAGERWCGSPAAKVEEGLAPQADDQAGPVRRVLTGLALTLAALVLPLVSIIPIAPGLITMIEIDWNSESYTYLLLSPVLAITYVVLMCVLTVLAKRLILGRVHAGRYSIHSWFYVRFWFVQQINDLALRLLHPIYATLYVVPWYRALGVKVGRRAEISTAAAIVPDLVDIGPESFIADAVQFGAARGARRHRDGPYAHRAAFLHRHWRCCPPGPAWGTMC
jgi:non-ribosomal peptide synthetase-like protein